MTNYPTRRSGTITTICMVCGKLFQHFKSNNRKNCSKECQYEARKDYRPSDETRRKMSEALTGMPCNNSFGKGEENPNWKGGISSIAMKIRQTKKYRRWRKMVYARDHYTCQKCGSVGRNLNAHHIIPFAESESKRFDLDNGITFCKECHRSVHSGDA